MDFGNWKGLVDADSLRQILAIPFTMLVIVAFYQIQKKIRAGTRKEGISFMLVIIGGVVFGRWISRWISQCFA